MRRLSRPIHLRSVGINVKDDKVEITHEALQHQSGVPVERGAGG